MLCKKCGSSSTIRNGHYQGQQRYKCKVCGYSFTETNATYKSTNHNNKSNNQSTNHKDKSKLNIRVLLMILAIIGIVLFLPASISLIVDGKIAEAIIGLVLTTPFAFLLVFQIKGMHKAKENSKTVNVNQNIIADEPNDIQKNIITTKPNVEGPSYTSFKIKIVGVTFKNTNSTYSRQNILECIQHQTPPFNGELDLELKSYLWENQLAFGIYANNEQIGNVPKEYCDEIEENWEAFAKLTNLNIYGGQDGKSYGASIDINFYTALCSSLFINEHKNIEI